MLLNIVQKKIIKLQIVSFILLSLIGIKLCYSQINQYNYLINKADDLWERSFPLEASRGYIKDRNGVNLAINIPTISVVCIPYQIKDKEKTSKVLSSILEVDNELIFEKISKKASIIRLSPEGRQISEEKANTIQESNLAGVSLVQDSKRY